MILKEDAISSFVDQLIWAAQDNDWDTSINMVRAFGTEKHAIMAAMEVIQQHKHASLLKALFHSYWSSLEIVPEHLKCNTGTRYQLDQQNMLWTAVLDLVVANRRSWVVHAIKLARIPPEMLYDLGYGQLGEHITWTLFGLDYTSTDVTDLDNPFGAIDWMSDPQHQAHWGDGLHPMLFVANGTLGRTKMKQMVQDHTSYDLQPHLTSLLLDPEHTPLSANIHNIDDIVDHYQMLGIDLTVERYQGLLIKFTHQPLGIVFQMYKDRQEKAFDFLHALGQQLWTAGGERVAEQILDDAVETGKHPHFVDRMLGIFPPTTLAYVVNLHQEGRWPQLTDVMASSTLVTRHLIAQHIGADQGVVDCMRKI